MIYVMESTTKDWRDKAACKDADPELFFPASKSELDQERAKDTIARYCIGCAVIADCLDYAINKGEDSGIWGGQTESQRLASKRRAQRSRFNRTNTI